MTDMTMTPENLLAGRKYLGLTQAQLAHQLGVTQSMVAKVETGQKPAPAAYITRLLELAEARRCQLEAQALTPIPAQAAQPAPSAQPAPAPENVKFLKSIGRIAPEKVAELPSADFDSVLARLADLTNSYDEKVKLRANDILGRLQLALARAKAKADLPTPAAPSDDKGPYSGLTDAEFALAIYLRRKGLGEDLSEYFAAEGSQPPHVRDGIAVLSSLGLQPTR